MKIAKIAKNNKNKKNNIALVGHMGSGKSILGKLIAKNLKLEHIDTDKLIVNKLKKPIIKIFDESGEAYFRKVEEDVILNIKKNNVIISLGGGSILSSKIRNLLEKKFFSVFIDVNLNILYERLKNSKNRPLLRNLNIVTKINELDNQRRKYYLLSDIILENNSTITNTYKEFNNKYRIFYEKDNKN